MKLTTALTALLLPPAFGAEIANGGGLRHATGSTEEAGGDVATADRGLYWVAPLNQLGLQCIDNSIRAGGDKDDDYKCIAEGEALCINYGRQYFGGQWTFGVKDSRVKLWNPNMEVVWEFCTEVTHVCIGEEQGSDPNHFSEERPYLTFYNEKTTEVVGKLTCDGTDGKDAKNLGQTSILKMVDQSDLGQYVEYPIDIVKFKKGQTPNPEDDNALWNIAYNPTNPQSPWWDGIRYFDATDSYNKDKCVWTDQCQKCSMNTNQCVLKDLYDSTNGDSWNDNTGWDFTEVSDPCSSKPSSWYGITCDGGDITEIELVANNLVGTIPTVLAQLKSLKGINFNFFNEIEGTIPTELGSLANLEYLDLAENQLTGTIPTELGLLSKLEDLTLHKNQLTGSIPPALGQLASLEYLDLVENEFTGKIPTELGLLASLRYFWLDRNDLSGPIPAELGNLASLEELDLQINKLTGTIPAELGKLKNLKSLLLYRNIIEGTIPAETGLLSNLVVLKLFGNNLVGTIPTELGNLTKLEELQLQGNVDLNGTIPTEFGHLVSLTDIDISYTELTGTIPTELGLLTELRDVEFESNGLTGQIPTQLGNLTNLEFLYLGHNKLNGTIPTFLGQFTNLKALDIGGNELIESIPTQLGNLTNLEVLYLDDNSLTGSIPFQLGMLNLLRDLYLDENQLTGKIPTEIGLLSNLVVLDMQENQLTGTIPAELGTLVNLLILRLDNNTFKNGADGAVPDELCEALFVTEPIVRDFELDNVAGNDTITNITQCEAAKFESR